MRKALDEELGPCEAPKKSEQVFLPVKNGCRHMALHIMIHHGHH
jgi:hypothetical protein